MPNLTLEKKVATLEREVKELRAAVAVIKVSNYDTHPISMDEYRIACEKGDKYTVKKYLAQFEKH
ncbi:MAG: hypothetical protein WC750_06405 [Patescibacteria group bacterium]